MRGERGHGAHGFVEFRLLAVDHGRDEIRIAASVHRIGMQGVEGLARLAGEIVGIGGILVAEFNRVGPRNFTRKRGDLAGIWAARRGTYRVLYRVREQPREVVILRELQELSYQDIAEITSVPIGTVMSRLSRARKLLAIDGRRRLEESTHGR